MISTWVDFCVDCTCSWWGWGGVDGLTVIPAVSGGGVDGLTVVPAVSGGGVEGLTVVPAVSGGGVEGLTVVPAISGGGVEGLTVVPAVSGGGGSDRGTCSKCGVGRAANHYVLAIVCYTEGHSLHYTAGLMIISLRSPSKFPGRVLYRTVSVHCVINAEHQACEVQCLLLQFLGLSCRPWRNVRRQTTSQLEATHQQRKSVKKYAEDFPLIFMGCDVNRVQTLFTNLFVVHNIALSAADHDICSGACFCKSELRRRTIYMGSSSAVVLIRGNQRSKLK